MTYRYAEKIAIFVLLGHSFWTNAYNNIYGDKLETCSSTGQALTGYTRNGLCVTQNDDAGSHHICIDLSSTSGGNFCQVTRQPNWCDEKMACHDEPRKTCQIQNWCVCQWAFASYVERAGGCDKIQSLKCKAINEQAILAYEKAAVSNPRYANALSCLKERCRLSQLSEPSSANMSGKMSSHRIS